MSETDDAKQVAHDRYARVVGRVRHNTGGYQPPLASQASIIGSLCGGPGGDDHRAIRRALSKALENGDLFRWESADGTQYLGLDDADALRDRIASHATRREDPARQLCAVASLRIQHLENRDYDYSRGDGDE